MILLRLKQHLPAKFKMSIKIVCVLPDKVPGAKKFGSFS